MQVRPERRQDIGSVRAVHTEAFRRTDTPGADPPEAGLVDELRTTAAWIPELSLVAVVGGEVVGHVCTTRGHVDEEPVLTLGPIGVLVTHQGQGIGSALVRETVRIAKHLGEPLIALLGSPMYYGRFGFEPSTEHGIEPPDPEWGDHFQVKALNPSRGPIEGTFRFPQPFDAL